MNRFKRITAGLTALCMGLLCLPLNSTVPEILPDTALYAAIIGSEGTADWSAVLGGK